MQGRRRAPGDQDLWASVACRARGAWEGTCEQVESELSGSFVHRFGVGEHASCHAVRATIVLPTDHPLAESGTSEKVKGPAAAPVCMRCRWCAAGLSEGERGRQNLACLAHNVTHMTRVGGSGDLLIVRHALEVERELDGSERLVGRVV